MAYQKEIRKITAGGLSLLPPSDLVQEPDSLILQNWRPEQAGALVSRRGMARYASGLGGPVHSLFRVGNDRFGAVGASLLAGPALASTVATGFDGEPLFFAAHQDRTWVMNRGRQVKANGTAAAAYVPAAPEGKIVAAAGVQTALRIAECESTEGWDVRLWAGGEVREDPDAFVVAASAGTVTVTMGSATATGLGTSWTPDLAGKRLRVNLPNGTIYYALILTVESATSLTLVNAFPVEGGSGLIYAIGTDVQVLSFDTGNKISGSQSVSLNCYTAGRWQAELYLGTPKDTKLFGVANDRDQFKVWVYAENPAAVQRIRITVFSGDAVGSPALTAEITDPSVLLNPASYAWTQLSILRGLDPIGFAAQNAEYQDLTNRMAEADAAGNLELYGQLQQQRGQLYDQLLKKAPYFRNVGAIGEGFDWGAVTRVWFEFQTTEPGYLHLDQVDMVGSLGGALQGEFVFFVTFDTPEGHESSGGGDSDPVQFDNQPASLSSIPVSPDPQVTRRHIYVQGGPFPFPLRCDTIHDNAATTHVLSVDVDAVQNAQVEMPVENDPPPAARGICGPYGGRLIAWSSAEHVARYWYTPVGKPYAWPGAADEGDGNWEDVGDAKEELLRVIPKARMVVFYKEASIHRTLGDVDLNSPEKTSVNVPIFGPRAVCDAGAVDYLAGGKGVFRFNGDSAELVSGQVQPIFEGQYVELPDGTFAVPVNPVAPRSSFVMEYRAGRVYFSYPEEGSSAPNACLVYEEATGRWYNFRTALGGLSALHFEKSGSDSGLFAGTVGGGLYQLEAQRTTDDGQAIEVVWESKADDFGLANSDKVVAELGLVARTADNGEAPSTLTVKAVLDGATVTLGTLSAAARETKLFKLGNAGDGKGAELLRAAVRVEGAISSTVRIFQSYWRWYPLDHAGLTYDTGIVNFGTPKVKEIDELVLDVTPEGGTVSWGLMSDLPGNVLADRETGGQTVIPGARQTIRVPLAAIRAGVTWRFHAWSDRAMQVHGVSFRMRVVGVFIDGAAGDFWESDAASVFEHQLVYLIREAELLADTDGPMTFRLWTELPEVDLVQKVARVFDTQALSVGKLPVRLRFPGNVKGQLRKVRVDGGSSTRLYGCKLYARPLGSAAPWAWYDVPVAASSRDWAMAEVGK